MKYTFHPDSRDEFYQTVDYYEKRQANLDGAAKSQFIVVRASSLREIYCRQDACTTIGSLIKIKSILFAGSSTLGLIF